MALEKLQAFTTFLIEQNMVDENQLDSWMENGKVVPASRNLGNGFLICRFQYEAVISIERFAKNERVLMALVCAWLHDHDSERQSQELPPPDIDVEILDNQTADVELRVMFREDISLKDSDEGDIPFNGRRWHVAPVVPDVATIAAVGDDPGKPTDKPYHYGDDA